LTRGWHLDVPRVRSITPTDRSRKGELVDPDDAPDLVVGSVADLRHDLEQDLAVFESTMEAARWWS
jgi:hypothetical protein